MSFVSAQEKVENAVRQPLPSAEAIAKLPKDGGPEFNRLVFEKSPYLLQHARNPVDWRPWGEEAFAAAAADKKPIFLSVGYATCHWCHVMEHESFEDAEVAKLLNENFICIKVDREEMPHVDQVYMTVTQGMTGSGGWPMSVIMTADRKPFFAGTYFPKATFTQILNRILAIWKAEPAKVIEQAEGITKQLQEMAKTAPGTGLEPSVFEQAFSHFQTNYDPDFGGLAQPPRFAPKFPTPHDYSFLLRYWGRTGSEKALEMVENSLTKMRWGGVYDQLGFGIHRYSTDREWLVPHFEKMLYDQALVAIANLDAYQATGKSRYRQTAEEILTYVLRDMHSAEGGFYSAEDADSEGEEGKFYVWTLEEIERVLGKDKSKRFAHVFGITEGGNFKEEATQQLSGANIPHLDKSLTDIAADLKVSEDDLRQEIEADRVALLAVREKRVHPFKDDKVLTDWNGLMIAALARASQVLDEPLYAEAAEKAVAFILKTLRHENGRLMKRFRQGEAGLEALAEDYAYLTWGLIELYEARFDPAILAEAKALTDSLLAHYWDDASGGFFTSADDGEALIVRSKEAYDGALPSGNSVSALNLLRLARLTGQTHYEERAQDILKAFSTSIQQVAGGFSMMLQAYDFLTSDTREIVVVGKRDAEDTKAMLQLLRQRFDPNKVVLFKEIGEQGEALGEVVEFVREHQAIDGKATAYICRNFACQLPTSDLEKVKELIAPKAKP